MSANVVSFRRRPSVGKGGPGDGVRELPEGGEVNLPDDGVDGGCPTLLLNTLGYRR